MGDELGTKYTLFSLIWVLQPYGSTVMNAVPHPVRHKTLNFVARGGIQRREVIVFGVDVSGCTGVDNGSW